MDSENLYSPNELEEISSPLWVMADSPLFIYHNLANQTDTGEELQSLYNACKDFISRYEDIAKELSL